MQQLRRLVPHLALFTALLAVLGCACDSNSSNAPAETSAYLEPLEDEIPLWFGSTNRPLNEEGRWRKTPHSTEEQKLIDDLEALGYVDGSREAPTTTGITRHIKGKVYAGLNVYSSGHAQEALLFDMEGRQLHRWHYDFHKAFPDFPKLSRERQVFADYWRRVFPLPNGDLLAIYGGGLGMIRLDKESNLLWANRGKMHHDADILPDGTIYVLTRKGHYIPRIRKKRPIVEDYVSVLDPKGREFKRVSLLKALENSPFADRIQFLRRSWPQHKGDILHTNSIQVLDGAHASAIPEFKKGNVLVSFRSLNMIAVVDMYAVSVVWMHDTSLQGQHDPNMLPDGNILVFDNQTKKKWSRIVELDPKTRHEVWTYRGTKDQPFFSAYCGAVARLPNGNTLISSTDAGRAFEVDRSGKVVWEFFNPHRAGSNDEFIASIFEVTRLPSDFGAAWLKK